MKKEEPDVVHQTSPNHGYLFRRVSRSIRASPTEEDENRRGNRTKSTEEEEEDEDEDEEEDEESLETVGDPSQMAASQDNVRGKHESMIIIKVEMSIVYSRTYRIPMLCFQAYDQGKYPTDATSTYPSIHSLIKGGGGELN